MATIPAILCVFVITVFSRGGVSEPCRGPRCFSSQDWSRPCAGAHCPGRAVPPAPRRPPQPQQQPQPQHGPARPRAAHVHPSYQQDAHYAQSAPLAPYAVFQPARAGSAQPGGDGAGRTNPRTVTAEVFHPGCAGGTCASASTVSHRPTGGDGGGAPWDPPPRTRQAQKPCVGDGCGTHAGADGRGNPSPVRVTDRAAQFLDERPEFGAERGAWIQLTCDMKPGQYGAKSGTKVL